MKTVFGTTIGIFSALAIAGTVLAISRPKSSPQVFRNSVRAAFPQVVQKNAGTAIPGETVTVTVNGSNQIDGTYIASPCPPTTPTHQHWNVTLVSVNPNQGWPQGKVIINRNAVVLPNGTTVIVYSAGAWYELDGYGTILGDHILSGGDPLLGGSCNFSAPWQGSFGVNSTATVTVSP